jgi:FtsP/CotA-like multicopper oxidase with cupredoxin domain
MMAGISRRDLMASGIGLAGLVAAGALPGCGSGGGGDSGDDTTCASAVFPQPTEFESASGLLNFPMNVIETTNTVGTPAGNRLFKSRTFNGGLAGETLRLQAGDRLTMPITNNLTANLDPVPADQNTPHHFNSVNMHTHGFHVSPSQDDVLVKIAPGAALTYNYDLPADHPAGTMWYHPHKHGATAMQLFSGMSGVIVIEGDASNGDLNTVTEIGAADEIIFNVNELNLNGFGLDPNSVTAYEVAPYVNPRPFLNDDRVFVVNGEFRPTLEVLPGQVVRLRMLNSSARTTLPISIESTNMHLCSLDGITIPAVRNIGGITLAPGNRADVMVQFPTAGTYNITAAAVGNATAPGILAVVEVSGDQCDMDLPSGSLPTVTSLPDITAGEVTETRTLTYAVGGPGPVIGGAMAPNFTLDGVRFDDNVVNQNLTIGSIVEWTLVNTSNVAHPHHIHIHPFQVFETSDNLLNGLDFPAEGSAGHVPAWLDTVMVPPNDGMNDGFVKLRQRYPDNPGDYVIHCHILVHEDIGMMQLVRLSSV